MTNQENQTFTARQSRLLHDDVVHLATAFLTFAADMNKYVATSTMSMSKYRARSCPKCGYYLGFSISQRLPKAAQVAVTNFCLNCNYKLPVVSIVRGVRRAPRPPKRALLRLISESRRNTAMPLTQHQGKSMGNAIGNTDYGRHLRIIGQDLENLHFSRFNLEFTGEAYLVWARPESGTGSQNPILRISRSRLQKLWKNRMEPRSVGHEETYTDATEQPARRLRYTIQDLDRIERERRQLRRRVSGNADGHGLSQLLRTIGELVEQRNERLLGIAWQELSISMIAENSQGRKGIDVFRPDNLYDLWVKMYLKRGNRAISDTPR
jgi:hypothetical protein